MSAIAAWVMPCVMPWAVITALRLTLGLLAIMATRALIPLLLLAMPCSADGTGLVLPRGHPRCLLWIAHRVKLARPHAAIGLCLALLVTGVRSDCGTNTWIPDSEASSCDQDCMDAACNDWAADSSWGALSFDSDNTGSLESSCVANTWAQGACGGVCCQYLRSTCTNTCTYASDDACDDGGPGSKYDICALGSDCTHLQPELSRTTSCHV